MTHKIIKDKLVSELNINDLSNTKIFNFVDSITNDLVDTISFLAIEGYLPGEIKKMGRRVISGKTIEEYFNQI